MNNQNLFCRVPFTEISIDIFGQVWPGCCPDWVEFPFGNILEQPWEEIWNGENAINLENQCMIVHCDIVIKIGVFG